MSLHRRSFCDIGYRLSGAVFLNILFVWGQDCPPSDTISVSPLQDEWAAANWNNWQGIEMVTWNIENFPKNGTTTINGVAEVMLDIMADIYAVQEIEVEETSAFVGQLMSRLPNYDYVLGESGYYTNSAILYRKEVLTVTRSDELWEDSFYDDDGDDDYENNALYYFASRPPLRVDFQWECGSGVVGSSVINVHLKCCDFRNSDLERRRISAQLLRDYLLDQMASGDSNFVVLGDWNDDLVDVAHENAFSRFLNDSTNFQFVTLPLARDPDDYYDSYPSRPSFLDHILISRGLFNEAKAGEAVTFRLDDLISDYSTILSDHRPVGWRFPVPSASPKPAVVINEIMKNSGVVDDYLGEWFELYNTDTVTYDLHGWTIKDDGTDEHVIESQEPLFLEPGQYRVLGREDDSFRNGGVHMDYEYSSINLGNDSDEIIMLNDEGLEMDRVEYDGGEEFPDPAGKSMALLDPALDNNVGSHWAESTLPYGGGDFGTPGGFNFPYSGPIWHVSTTGSDDMGDGSEWSPLATVQEGIDLALEGDTILIHPGIYVENINFNGKNLALGSRFLFHGDTSYISQTIIDGDSSGSVITFEMDEGNGAVLTGLTLLNGHADRGGGIYISHSSPTIDHCIIRDNAATYYGGGLYIAEESEPTVVHSSIVGNRIGEEIIPALLGAGIYCQDSQLRIVHSAVIKNRGSLAGGIVFERSGGESIHCTISQNNGFSSGGVHLLEGSVLKFVNGLLWENEPEEITFAIYGDSSSVAIAYSDIPPGAGTAAVTGNGTVEWLEGNIEVDPLFVNPGKEDFSLRESSPCIDAGTPFFEWQDDTLIDVTAHIYEGLAPDMGAFEFGAVSVAYGSDPVPVAFALHQNFPNPFNGVTAIPFALAERTEVVVSIHDLLGRRTKLLVEGMLEPGLRTFTWDGTDDMGRPVAAGIYICKISAEGMVRFADVRKMILLR